MSTLSMIEAMREAGCDDATILRAVEAAERKRLDKGAERVRRHREAKRNDCNVTDVTPVSKKETPPIPPKEKNISHTRTREGQPVAEPIAEQFRQAWAVWPKGQGRNCGEPGACRAWIAQTQDGADPAELLAACRAYARKADPDYALDFANFMQRQTWREWLPKAAPSVDWASRLRSFAASRVWAPSWGPEPGMSGCKAPADALKAAGYEPGPLAIHNAGRACA